MEQRHHFRGAWRCYPVRRFQEARPHGDDAGRVWIFGEPAAEKIGIGLERPTYFIHIHPALHGMVWDYRQGMDFETGADVMSCRFGERAYVRSAEYNRQQKNLIVRFKAAEEVRVLPQGALEERTADGFAFSNGEVGGFVRSLTPCRWAEGALCCAGEAILAVALGYQARERTHGSAAEGRPVQGAVLRLGERADDFGVSNERLSLDAAQNQGMNALLSRFYRMHCREAEAMRPLTPMCECEQWVQQALSQAREARGEAAGSALIRLCRAHLNDGLYLESGDVRGLSGGRSAEDSRQLIEATRTMAATIQQMLIRREDEKWMLLGALPGSWAKGRLSGLTLDGGVELDYLEWSRPGRWVDVKLRARTPARICLRFPAPLPEEGAQQGKGAEMTLRMLAGEQARRFVRLARWEG